ncbi:MAG: ABC transporter permease [Dehalococcoidales bacterium]|nr:ABC transporter permease [Dehalococcoidales bacterium]
MKRSLLLTLHELQIFFQDKSDLVFSLLLPIAVFALMYFGFSGETVFHGTANIVNLDENGKYSTELIDRLGDDKNIEIDYYTEEDAEIRLERSDLIMVLYIPEGFSEKITAGETASLVFRQRGNGGQEGQIVASIVSGIAEDISRDIQVYKSISGILSDSGVQESAITPVVNRYLEEENSNPIISVTETTIGSSPDMVNQFLPGVINMFVLFSISLSASAIVEEKRRGTLERLLTTRLTVGQIFTGKFLANVCRGFVQTLILLALAYAVFGMFTPASFLECLAIALVFAAAAGGIGLIIATVARTSNAASWIAVFFTMAMVMLGGSFFEIAEGSGLYTISRISIISYANEAFKTIIAEGGSIADIGMELGILAAVFVVSLGISRILFKIIPGGR